MIRDMQGHIIYQSIWHIRKKEPNMSCNMLRWRMSSIKHAQLCVLYVGLFCSIFFLFIYTELSGMYRLFTHLALLTSLFTYTSRIDSGLMFTENRE
ncbi:hypothetical protein HanRHA438_Chr11g0511591 [Helianthus annuus]|uniref:Uncharacterized protein n=2 Tax=Helianthus annuus TaxID=4232 RepID=A0A9K3HR08_HELAN|nr:hypothetical protein HanXRQr2_Chr11g0498911 [Helianthus annuus]KAJ0502150.1 hypothetical protein HanHA300_Chr11g0409441 [Helianthus annuus]KAJ0510130.1 hypothetical protein HanIR_Chr11g0537171 [Helianthus annuus]KAJ0518069.1 hypothetical protein HanHA89_Chr11g0433081 [Helianthus annuus]KAJ0686096.1 hypothetical protein HanLR1_Chr11g0410691 [Helianthus annuus]